MTGNQGMQKYLRLELHINAQALYGLWGDKFVIYRFTTHFYAFTFVRVTLLQAVLLQVLHEGKFLCASCFAYLTLKYLS